MKRRKLSKARQDKLDRVHLRDCPGATNIEFACLECLLISRKRAKK